MHRTTRKLVGATLLSAAMILPLTAVTVGLTKPAIPSDFDGDGYADLAVGVPGEDIGSTRDAGMVNVLYGGATGLTAAGDQAWSQDTAGVRGTSEGGPAFAGDAFGSALASADFDRDGRADLAIGVPSDRVGATRYAGAVNVLHGTRSGLSAADDQRWSQGNLSGVAATGEGFGQSLAAGDFDGDGYADLAIGIPGEDHGTDQAPGTVMIVYGSASGLVATDAWTLTREMTGEAYDADTTPHGFGCALAAGDLDGDGFADLAIGAPASGIGGDDPERPLVDGEVTVVHGSAEGLTVDGSQLWSPSVTDMPGGAEAGDRFGSSLTIADFDGDTFGDLAIGIRFDRVNAVRAGAVNVLYGSVAGLTTAGAQWWHQDQPDIPDTAEADDDFGRSVASGDLDGDGYADLAVGVPGESLASGEPGAGLVNVLYGSATGLDGAGAQAWTQASPSVPGRPEATDIEWDAFGQTLTIGDFGRSARDDLAVGVPLERVAGRAAAGMVNVLYGRASGLSGTNAQGWSQRTPGVKGAPERDDTFGLGLAP